MTSLPRIVLVRPALAGNVGFVARAMMNMGLDDLRLVHPAYDDHEEAFRFASGAHRILDTARRHPTLPDAIEDCRWVIGTTRRVGDKRQSNETPRSLALRWLQEPRRHPAAIVFGPEKDGLSAEDLKHCHDIVTIPSSDEHPSLNLSHAVILMAYELFLARLEAGPSTAPAESRTATVQEMEGLFEHLERALLQIGFVRRETSPHQMLALRRLLARARPSHDEVIQLRGICRQILWASAAAQGQPHDKGPI